MKFNNPEIQKQWEFNKKHKIKRPYWLPEGLSRSSVIRAGWEFPEDDEELLPLEDSYDEESFP